MSKSLNFSKDTNEKILKTIDMGEKLVRSFNKLNKDEKMQEIKLSDGTTIKMRRPKVRDMNNVKNIADDLDREQALIINLTEMTQEELENMDVYDYKLLQTELVGLQSTKPKP